MPFFAFRTRLLSLCGLKTHILSQALSGAACLWARGPWGGALGPTLGRQGPSLWRSRGQRLRVAGHWASCTTSSAASRRIWWEHGLPMPITRRYGSHCAGSDGRNGRLSRCARQSRRRSRAWLLPTVWFGSPRASRRLSAPAGGGHGGSWFCRCSPGGAGLARSWAWHSAGVKVTPDSFVACDPWGVPRGRRDPRMCPCRIPSRALSSERCPLGVSCRGLSQARGWRGGWTALRGPVGPGEAGGSALGDERFG